MSPSAGDFRLCLDVLRVSDDDASALASALMHEDTASFRFNRSIAGLYIGHTLSARRRPLELDSDVIGCVSMSVQTQTHAKPIIGNGNGRDDVCRLQCCEDGGHIHCMLVRCFA